MGCIPSWVAFQVMGIPTTLLPQVPLPRGSSRLAAPSHDDGPPQAEQPIIVVGVGYVTVGA